ncbi:MAG TPA: M81 family metallopeptidase [Clostridiaceae bacterium]|nr:M81 family metallopeptidase [Clostridiaceae bacterium]
MKILIGHFGHEANTFSSRILDFDEFKDYSDWLHGDVLKEIFLSTPTYLGGMLEVGNKYGVDLFASISAEAPAPLLSRECAESCLAEILEDIRAVKGGLDGICYMLHGAGCAEGIDDLESYILQSIRQETGEKMPICVPLDLHGNITPEMAELATLFGIKQYPHIDCKEAGMLAMKTCIESIEQGMSPQTTCIRLPLLLPCSAGYTFAEPFTSIQPYLDEYKNTHDLIDVTFFHGFPYCDRAITGASVVVTAWSDPAEHAKELADYIWQRHQDFQADILSAAEALDRAEESRAPGYIVINELSDNAGGGAPGDGTHLLRELLARDLPKSIFGYIYDKVAVNEIYKHKVGDRISFYLGGNTEPLHGAPLYIKDAKIINLSDGDHISTSPIQAGVPHSIGRSARVRTGNVEIIVGSKLTQTYDDRPFLITGADIEQYRFICLKSAHHSRAYFDDRAGEIIACDTPGILSGNLSAFKYKYVPRPIYPLDERAELLP